MGMYSHDEMDSYYDTKDTSIVPVLNTLAQFAQMPESEIKKAIARHIRNEITQHGGFSLSPYEIYSSCIPITSYNDTVVEMLKLGMSEEENKCLDLYIYWLKKRFPQTHLIHCCMLVLDYGQIEKRWFDECKECYIPYSEYITKLSKEKQAFLGKIEQQSLESLVSEMEEENRIEREQQHKRECEDMVKFLQSNFPKGKK